MNRKVRFYVQVHSQGPIGVGDPIVWTAVPPAPPTYMTTFAVDVVFPEIGVVELGHVEAKQLEAAVEAAGRELERPL